MQIYISTENAWAKSQNLVQYVAWIYLIKRQGYNQSLTAISGG